MQSNISNKLMFFVIDKKYNVDFIKSFVEFTSKFNKDDGFYIINNDHDLYSPSYVNALICKYPYKKYNLQYLLKDVTSVIKKTEDDSNRYLIIITDGVVEERLFKNMKELNVSVLVKNSIDKEVVDFCFEGIL
jgi:hypothetical protein